MNCELCHGTGYFKSNTAEFEGPCPNGCSCGMCGGAMTEIRGRYPSDPKRLVCPTCLAERMDRIHEESARDYGVADQVINLPAK